jgi:hypothetical protein
MWAICPFSTSSGYHAEFHEGYRKHTNPLNCRTSSSDISGYFHEGHSIVVEWQGHGIAWVYYRGREIALERLGHGMVCVN